MCTHVCRHTRTHAHMNATFTDKVYFRNMKETKQKLIYLLFMIQSFLSNCRLLSIFLVISCVKIELVLKIQVTVSVSIIRG